MQERWKTRLIIINDFAHDLFSGFWLSCIIVMYMLDKKAGAMPDTAAAAALHDVLRLFFLLVVASLGIVLATGIGRYFTYGRPAQSSDEEGTRKKLLVIKHVFLGAAFIGGTWLAYSSAYR